jgi:hypothetical protein
LWGTYLKTNLSEALTTVGDLDEALEVISSTIEDVERPEWDEKAQYAEMLRIRGWILYLKRDLDGAERNYSASLVWSRQQGARSWELRTAAWLARLWKSQGKRREAYDLLAPIYNWFTEGFDTHDLKSARWLLQELNAR